MQELLIELITRVFSECGTELTEEDGEVLSELLFGMLNAVSLHGAGNIERRSVLVYDMFIAYAEKQSKALKTPRKRRAKKEKN